RGSGALPTRRSTPGTAPEPRSSRHLPQAPSRRLRIAIRRSRHRLGPELTNLPQRPNAGIAPCRIHRGTRAAAALYPKASDKGQRAGKGQRKGAKGKGPILKRPKGAPSSPSSGVRHALAVPAQKGATRRRHAAHLRHRNSERVDAAGGGRIAAGHAAPAETAGTHLAA